MPPPLGEHLARALAGHDWLSAHDDDALIAARLVIAPDVTGNVTCGRARPTRAWCSSGRVAASVTRCRSARPWPGSWAPATGS